MDLHRDSADSPAAEQPAGKLNKTAFKLFGRRRGGGTMPSIFGVRNKGESKSSGNGAAAAAATGMVRSRTHDGLAEVALESSGGGKEEPCSGGEQRLPDPATSTTDAKASSGSVAKSHSFLSLLRKNGRCEGGEKKKQQQPHAEPRQKKGLRGLLHSMRWHRRDRGKGGGEEEEEDSSDSPSALILPCSLTASLECVQEEETTAGKPPSERPADAPQESAEAEPPRPAEEQPPSAGVGFQGSPSPAASGHSGQVIAQEEEEEEDTAAIQLPGPGVQEEEEEKDGAITGEIPVNSVPLVEPECDSGQEAAAPGPDPPSSVDPLSERSVDRICLMFADVTSLKSFDSLTGCGDIIADQEEDGGSATCGKPAPGGSKKAMCKKDPNLVTYQGGGEEMASPDGVDDTYLPEFWEMLPLEQGQVKEREERTASPTRGLEKSKCAQKGDAGSPGKLEGLDHTPLKPGDKAGDAETRDQRLQECIVANSDEDHWRSTTPGPEEGSTCRVPEEGTAREGGDGRAPSDLHTDPEESLAGGHSEAKTSCSKPMSPLTTTCPLKTASGFKESKIPISIKHLPLHPPSQGAEASSNSPLATQQQPTKTEVPRTKIPVSKVLVRRVSNRVLTGAALKAAAFQDTAKK
ncbi:APC membrane recruitment protein 2 [Rhinatrema bivittatum]|uniref:APC membrane recruitment protein 2 n=1 Tax=Rhinatrema bivittatum TaxID=194408 RepID=UPI00112AC2A3|nr:APC membrane recruitment protein 2 [Rhinatrema bivittatum]